MAPVERVSSFVGGEGFESTLINRSSSSAERNALSEPNTDVRRPFCRFLDRSLGLSEKPAFSLFDGSPLGIEGLEGVEREAKMESVLLLFLPRTVSAAGVPEEESSHGPVDTVGSVGRKMPRLFRRRTSGMLRGSRLYRFLLFGFPHQDFEVLDHFSHKFLNSPHTGQGHTSTGELF